MSLINVTKSTYKQSLRDYFILDISYLRAQTIETSSLPNDSMRLLFKQIEIFLGILTVLFNCKDFFENTRELLVVPRRDFASSGRIPCGGGNKAISLPPFSLIRDFRKQNTRGNVSKISVNHACYRQIGSKSTNHNH